MWVTETGIALRLHFSLRLNQPMGRLSMRATRGFAGPLQWHLGGACCGARRARCARKLRTRETVNNCWHIWDRLVLAPSTNTSWKKATVTKHYGAPLEL